MQGPGRVLSRYSDWLWGGRPGDRIPLGRDFPPVQTCPEAHPVSCTVGTGSFPGAKYGRGVLLTTHPLLVSQSWNGRAIPLPTIWPTTRSVTGTICLLLVQGTYIIQIQEPLQHSRRQKCDMKYHIQDPQILADSVQNSVAPAIWRPDLCTFALPINESTHFENLTSRVPLNDNHRSKFKGILTANR